MLRNVLLISSSGLVLFAKDFVNAVAQPRLVGSLVVAMLEFSHRATGLQLSYIEMSNVGVTVVGSDAAKLVCALFHDKEDGEDFGKLLATQILLAFLEDYPGGALSQGHNLSEFNGFHFKIATVVRDAAQPVLEKLHQNRAVVLALLITEDAVAHSTAEVDQLGVLANLQALISAASDLMALVKDSPTAMWLDSSPTRSSRLLVQRIDKRNTLVVQCSKRYRRAMYEPEVTKATALLRKVCVLGERIAK